MNYIIHQGDARLTVQKYPANHFDACLCDPPYGFTAFTHKRKVQQWEKGDVPDRSLWDEVFDRMRPGSVLMAASGPRLYHRMATRIEDAGFYILDAFNWIYNGANCTGVMEGYRLRPAYEPYVVAWKPKPKKVGRRFPRARFLGKIPTDRDADPALSAAIDAIQPVGGLFYCGKATPSERGPGCDHPTLKPLALTEALARLLLRPGAKRIMVPFSGAGSEIIGCLRAGWPEVVGFEMEKKYVTQAHRRIARLGKKEAA